MNHTDSAPALSDSLLSQSQAAKGASLSPETFYVEGALTHHTAMRVMAQGQQRLAHGACCHIDFSRMTAFDSSVIAVLLAWQQQSRTTATSLTLTSLPAGVEALAALYGVRKLLPPST